MHPFPVSLPFPVSTVMGRAVSAPAPVNPRVHHSIWLVMEAMRISPPVALVPSVHTGHVAIPQGRMIGVRAVDIVPFMSVIDSAINLLQDDPDGQCGNGAGEQPFGDVIGMPPVVGRGACGRHQQA